MRLEPDTCGRRGAKLLLLLNVLVVSASANCSRPMPPDEMILTDATLLRSGFPEGVSVTMDCFGGYDRISGTGYTTCTNGEWSKPDLVCTRKDCGPPPPQKHTIFDLSGGTLLHDKINVACEEGYQILGSTTRQCFAIGWVGRSRCKVKDCRQPLLQPNMTVSITNGTLYGAEIEVFCDKGYKLIGSRIRKCAANGWSGSPKCEVIRCKAPGELANGRSSWESQDDPSIGQSIQFFCNEGYVIAGESDIVCQENGEYDHLPPTCHGGTTKGITEVNSTPSTSTTPTPVSKSTDTSATSSAAPDGLLSTSVTKTSTGDGFSPSLKDAAPTPPTLMLTTSFPEEVVRTVSIDRKGYIAIIVCVSCSASVFLLVFFFTKAFYSKRTGSYDIREDLKPELLHFQSLWRVCLTKFCRCTQPDH